MAVALGRADELARLVCGAYSSSTGVLMMTAKDFRRESDKSFLIEGEHVMARIVVGQESDSLQVVGEKLQIVRKTRTTGYGSYSSYGGWDYDTNLKLYRRVVCAAKDSFQPTVGDRAPFKVKSCRMETVGVRKCFVITLDALRDSVTSGLWPR